MTFKAIAGKLQEELAEIIEKGIDVNDYELIVYKYLFITELGIPVHEDLGIEIAEDSFSLYIIPDDLRFDVLKELVGQFDRFDVRFKANPYNIIKLEFVLGD